MPKQTVKMKSSLYKAIGSLRIVLGAIFLWPFFDKLLGLGFSTCRTETGVTAGCDAAWLQGGSPTSGFLEHATAGPFAEMYKSLSGHMMIDMLFMAGLLLIGLALIFGVGIKVATVSGVLLLVMMWSAVLPPTANPVVDSHIVYAIGLIVIMLSNDHQRLGLGKWWAHRPIVKKYSWLQ